MKPGTSSPKRETQEEFAERMGRELRGEAQRIQEEAQKQAQKHVSDAKKKAKEIRKVASTFDGRRS